MMLESLKLKVQAKLDEYNNLVSVQNYKCEQLEKNKITLTKNLEVLKKEIELHTIASNFLQSIIETVCDSNLRKIETWVNLGLKNIFDDQNIEFQIEKTIKRNVNTYSFNIVQNGVKGSKNSFGGGVLCIISLILKFLFIELTKSPKLLVLDESLSFLSEKYIENCAKFISILSQEFGITTILITHQDKFKEFANRTYLASKDSGSTKFNLIENAV